MTDLRSHRGQWARPELESSLPHYIARQDGTSITGRYGPAVFVNKSTATRRLNQIIKGYDKRRSGGINDPRTWVVRPVKETK